jgi:hypothetical protein
MTTRVRAPLLAMIYPHHTKSGLNNQGAQLILHKVEEMPYGSKERGF